MLLDLLQDAGQSVPLDLQDLDVLTPFGALLRYEDVPTEVSIDRKAAREMVRRLRRYVESRLEE